MRNLKNLTIEEVVLIAPDGTAVNDPKSKNIKRKPSDFKLTKYEEGTLVIDAPAEGIASTEPQCQRVCKWFDQWIKRRKFRTGKKNCSVVHEGTIAEDKDTGMKNARLQLDAPDGSFDKDEVSRVNDYTFDWLTRTMVAETPEDKKPEGEKPEGEKKPEGDKKPERKPIEVLRKENPNLHWHDLRLMGYSDDECLDYFCPTT